MKPKTSYELGLRLGSVEERGGTASRGAEASAWRERKRGRGEGNWDFILVQSRREEKRSEVKRREEKRSGEKWGKEKRRIVTLFLCSRDVALQA